ncbi:MAG: Do family serine endopeptidase [Alphaproteobacteria bacterium]|nr:Do family serine endopeptidase [Alphaproteobacteria bacterium]
MTEPKTRATGKRRFLASVAVAALAGLGVGYTLSAAASPSPSPAAVEAASSTARPTAPVQMTAWSQPRNLADLVEQVSPAVVQITATGHLGNSFEFSSNGPIPPEMFDGPFGDFFRRFFDEPNGPQGGDGRNRPRFRSPETAALGSGFIINRDGVIVTNNHVVNGADTFKVKLKDGREFDAKLLGTDDRTDLAVLKIKANEPLPTVDWGDSDRIRVGDPVFAVGAPFGLQGTVTSGIVSARGRDIGAGPYDDFIQIDAPINRGNSGGPLFDAAGHVVGVNTAIVSPTGGSVGIGFSIPSDMAKSVVSQIVAHGSVERGWLGVSIQSVSQDMADSLGLKKAKGAIVADVTDGSPAAKAGVKEGDIIIKYDGKDIDSAVDLSRAVANTPAGQRADITVYRDGREQTLAARIDKLKDTGKQANAGPSRSGANPTYNGLGLALDEQDGQVVVSDIDPDSKAADTGLQPGDAILSINQKKVATVKEAENAIREAKSKNRPSVLARVERGDQQTFIAIPFAKS